MTAVPEAASALGVSERQVRNLLVSGELHGVRGERSWEVDAEDLDRLLRERQRHPEVLRLAERRDVQDYRGPVSRDRVGQLEAEVRRLTEVVRLLAEALAGRPA